MPKICYQSMNFQPWKMDMIEQVNQIVRAYKKQGYSLTLRQVYYQFVSRDILPQRWADAKTGSTNNNHSYENLGRLISDGRMAGLIDWSAIEDRTRELSRNSHWDNPGDIIKSASYSFALDKWEDQSTRVEVWVEKDALEGVIAKPCKDLDIAYFSCRGYTSQTAMWDAGRRLKEYVENGQSVIILHLGDHDPSGIDMSRDIEDRIRLFMESDESHFEIRRLALNMPQIQLYNPPPNPAKITDSRSPKYILEHGEQSWELDALEPRVIDALITEQVKSIRNETLWQSAVGDEADHKESLEKAARNWFEVAEFLDTLPDNEDDEDEDEG